MWTRKILKTHWSRRARVYLIPSHHIFASQLEICNFYLDSTLLLFLSLRSKRKTKIQRWKSMKNAILIFIECIYSTFIAYSARRWLPLVEPKISKYLLERAFNRQSPCSTYRNWYTPAYREHRLLWRRALILSYSLPNILSLSFSSLCVCVCSISSMLLFYMPAFSHCHSLCVTTRFMVPEKILWHVLIWIWWLQDQSGQLSLSALARCALSSLYTSLSFCDLGNEREFHPCAYPSSSPHHHSLPPFPFFPMNNKNRIFLSCRLQGALTTLVIRRMSILSGEMGMRINYIRIAILFTVMNKPHLRLG